MKLLDTDTCIGILKGVPSVVGSWRGSNERCALPSMVIGELFFGAANSRNPSAEAERVNRFADIFDELKPTRSLLRKFGEIKAELQKTGELQPLTLVLFLLRATPSTSVASQDCPLKTGS